MALVKKVLTEAAALTEGSVKKESKIMAAARTLHESGLAKRCPAVAALMESTNKADKAKAAVITTALKNTAALYESAGVRGLLKEDVTTSTAGLMPGVASLTPQVVDIVSIFYPQMVAHYIADIQALDKQTGEIFVIKTRYGMTAATVNAGDIIFEKPTDGTYASEKLGAKVVANGGTATYTLDLASREAGAPTTTTDEESGEVTVTGGVHVAIRKGSVRVFLGGKEVARDYGTGVLLSKNVNSATSTVDYAGGTVTVAFNDGVVEDGMIITAEALYDSEIYDEAIRTVEFDILEKPVRAEEHPLMSSYSVASALVANAHMNLDVDEMISNQLAGTIRWERDIDLIKKIDAAAAHYNELDFDCSANGTNLTLKQRYNAYDVMISTARGTIQEAMGRGTVEFMIVSAQQGLPIVEQIDGFVAAPEAKKPIGPYLAGTLRDGTINVIAVPYASVAPTHQADDTLLDSVVFGFKGYQAGDASVIVAEWVPLYFTPTFQAPNLKNHKGCLSFYDLFVNEPKYLAKGAIQNFNVAGAGN